MSEENLIEIMKENSRIQKKAYQRGFADGGNDMNEKWLITHQDLISKFVELIDVILNRTLEEDWRDILEAAKEEYEGN